MHYKILIALAIFFSLGTKAQTVNAGFDYAMYAPTNEYTLIATYSGFTPTTWAWTQVSGPACTIFESNKRIAVVRGMNTAGTYVFRATANGTYFDNMQVTVVANPTGNQWILQDNNEDGTFTEHSSPFSGFWTYNEWGYDTISNLVVSTEQASTGTYSYKMTLKRTNPPQSAGLSYRVEQIPFQTGNVTNVVPYWARVDVYLKDHIAEEAPEIVPLQEHHNQSSGSTGSPPIAIWSVNGSFYASIGYDSTTSNIAHNASSGASVSRVNAPGSNAQGLFYLAPATPNTWHRIVRYSNFSATDTGKVKIWINEQLVLDYTGPCWYREQFVYAATGTKFGLYKWPWNANLNWNDAFWGARVATSRTIYVDNIKYGNRLASETDFGISADPGNTPPNAVAGNDTTITLASGVSTAWAYLRGWASNDPDGSISTYAWTRISGPSVGTILNADQSQTTTSNLAVGTHVYRITVTDNEGATDTDDVSITILATPISTRFKKRRFFNFILR